MKVCIKTAHGYLSFQPDGRLEYRQVAGPWENLDLEGFVLQVQTPILTPDLGGPPPPVAPAPDMSRGYVQAVKDALIAEGVNLLGPCGAFAITKRVAWGLRGVGAGLLSKPSGNRCVVDGIGYATDIVCWPDRAYDILSDGGATNGATWNETGVDDLRARWRPAVQP